MSSSNPEHTPSEVVTHVAAELDKQLPAAPELDIGAIVQFVDGRVLHGGDYVVTNVRANSEGGRPRIYVDLQDLQSWMEDNRFARHRT